MKRRYAEAGLSFSVLVVEDNLADQENIRRCLTGAEVSDSDIEFVATAAEALTHFENSVPDVVLLDYALPDMDGVSLLGKLSSAPRQLSTAAVVLTGQGSETVAVKCMDIGAHNYIVKDDLSAATLKLAIRNARDKFISEQRVRSLSEDNATFVDAIAHDLRTPLTSVGLHLELLRESMISTNETAYDEQLSRIQQSHNQIVQRVGSLYQYVAAGGSEIPARTVALNDAVVSATNALEESIRARKVDIEIKELPVIYGDGAICTEIIQNVLENSIRYCIDAPRQITIEGVVDRVNDIVVSVGMVISDNGIGVQEEMIEMMFRPGWRAGEQQLSGEERHNVHSGLGLAICHRLIERLRGAIWAGNRESGGTEIYLTFSRFPSSSAEQGNSYRVIE